MRILYGIVGEGMGHATRSKVVLDELCHRGYEITIVVSGRAYEFISKHFGHKPNITIREIHGLILDYDNNKLDVSDSIAKNLKAGMAGLVKNVKIYFEITHHRFRPDVVISDFESWAYFFGIFHRIPVISIDNMQILNRGLHASDVTQNNSFTFKLAKQVVKMKLPYAYHYLVTNFFYPQVRKRRTTLVPPILRKEILDARREHGEHVLVYQTGGADEKLVATLKTLPYEFRFYGRKSDWGRDENIVFQPFSETEFVEDLRRARAVIATGGNSLMCEAVHLGVPMLARPIVGQFEQELNALYLKKLRYGDVTQTLDRKVLENFLEKTPVFEKNLESYPRQSDNSMLFNSIEELLKRIRHKQKPINKLCTKTMGYFHRAA